MNGLFHLFGDIYDGDDKIINSLLFDIHHHETPNTILQQEIITLLKNSSGTPIPLLCILYNITPFTSKPQILCQIISLYGAHFGIITHKFAHLGNHLTEEQKQKPEYKLMMFLQDNHLILHPKEHRLHHISPKYDVNFCIVNGWANPLLNSIVHIPFIHSRLFPDDVK